MPYRDRDPVHSGAKVEVGLRVPNGKIWVKGFALSGVVTRSAPANKIRVRFENMSQEERGNLRQFFEICAGNRTARRTAESNYIQLLK